MGGPGRERAACRDRRQLTLTLPDTDSICPASGWIFPNIPLKWIVFHHVCCEHSVWTCFIL